MRLYDARGTAFCWGSWLLLPGLPARYDIESALMVYHYALWLGFDSAWFEVRQENASVWRFHENFGARRTGVANGHYQYELPPAALQAALQKYRRYRRWVRRGGVRVGGPAGHAVDRKSVV